jgi:hypothetical protein
MISLWPFVFASAGASTLCTRIGCRLLLLLLFVNPILLWFRSRLLQQETKMCPPSSHEGSVVVVTEKWKGRASDRCSPEYALWVKPDALIGGGWLDTVHLLGAVESGEYSG